MGGPMRESRTPCNPAGTHCTTTLLFAWIDTLRQLARKLGTEVGEDETFSVFVGGRVCPLRSLSARILNFVLLQRR
jgi:hypothetical protein